MTRPPRSTMRFARLLDLGRRGACLRGRLLWLAADGVRHEKDLKTVAEANPGNTAPVVLAMSALGIFISVNGKGREVGLGAEYAFGRTPLDGSIAVSGPRATAVRLPHSTQSRTMGSGSV